ncbi:PH domain-containing protein [Parageobacillus toebii]|uniref:PH domain-containing protein n=1 Tax=Parageobacillus toebii TaxID=153151 RepID=UPI0035B538F1
MDGEPRKRISERALSVWRIYGMIGFAVSFIVFAAIIILIIVFDGPKWIIPILIIVLIGEGYFFIFFIPALRWRRWRYEVREQEIEIQKGLFVVKRTLIPMIRVQHVDSSQGPLLKKYRLASVTISTAATVHEIPALDEEEAEELRYSISRLARVADEDV